MTTATSARPLTDAMRRELRAIQRTGEPDGLYEYHGAEHLAFYAREKVLSALIARGLIEPIQYSAFALTDAGRAALTTP
jgi:hypothetical protein